MNVAVIGTGRVGLVTCVASAALGHDTIGTDVDTDKIELLQRGVPPFFEPGLREALAEQLTAGHLSFTANAADAIARAEVIFICVGTPARADGEADLLAVELAVREIARHAADGALVVEKSTVPAGTVDRVRETLRREGDGRRVHLASNPEFLREGLALRDAMEPDRIVLGVESQEARELLERLYRPLLERGVRLIVTDIRTAELAKHASNAFLATKISFVNALARICELTGADVGAVADVMGADPRIGRAFLDAGMGYGGYCLPKDVAALERLAARLGYRFGLLKEVERVNAEAVEALAERVEDALWNLEGKRIGILGLAFKPDTDDVRSSPAVALARRLLDGGAVVTGYDPKAGAATQILVPELRLADGAYEAATGADCLVLATDWEEFRTLDLAVLGRVMAHRVVVDGRNLFDPSEMDAAGFWYYPTGRPPILQHAQRSDASPSAVGVERPPALAGSPGSEIEWS
ncbi:MAG TPA: UDP-glucose/GDP-mannose dehydrogenase family protein [Actinomycetota bacterium]|nr:UDP-glucose/GDP-mannose dehydrogenase family protein [Actinomycetota bacterium]